MVADRARGQVEPGGQVGDGRVPARGEQFLDPALMRHALLDETFRQMGATLDLDQLARGLINIVVPHFSNLAGLLLLESLVAADEPPAQQADGSYLLRRMAVASSATGASLSRKPRAPAAIAAAR